MISVFDYIYMVNYTYRFTRIKPFLHLWNGTNLVMINDNLDVILNMICTYFIEYLNSSGRAVCNFLFPIYLFIHLFWYHSSTGFIKACSFLFCFLE